MIVTGDKKYSVDEYPMPNRDDEKIQKDEKRQAKYCIEFAKAMYAQYVKGYTYVGSELYGTVAEYRKYALGKQSEDKYKDSFLGKQDNPAFPITGNSNDRRKAYANIDFSIMSPMPRIIDALIGRLSKATDIVSVDAIDAESGAEKETMKWGMFVDGKYREMFSSLRAIAGLPQEELGYIPKNVEELNLFDAEGGFKQEYVIAMEELVKYVMDQSRWDEQLLVDVLFDLITNGFAVTENVYDDVTGEVRIEYRDPEYSGVQYTRESQYNKPDWGFSVIFEKMSTIKLIFPDLKEKELQSLAKMFEGQFGNARLENWNTASMNKNGSYGVAYDEFVVPVFRCRWIDVEYEYEVEHLNRFNHKRSIPYDGQRLGKRDKKVTTRKKMLYGCNWIIDSDYAYDYGVQRFQARDGMAEPILPFHAVKVKGRPIVPRVIPALDLFQNSWLKFQQGVTMATMNGLSVNMDSLTNLQLGNTKISPLEAIKIWRQTGIFFYKGTNIVGSINQNSRVIDQIAGGAGTMMQDALMGMQQAISLIEQTTGINPVTLGSNPNPEQGKAVTQFAIEGTNDVLKNIVSNANIMKSDAARAVCLRLQCVINHDPKAQKKYENVIGKTRLELLKIAEGHDVQYGIRTHVRPTDAEMNDIFEAVALSLKNGRDGKVGITEADAVRFKAMVYSGASLKRIAQLLAFANKQAQDDAEARAQRAQELNAQLGQQTEQDKAQLEAQSGMIEAQQKIAVEKESAFYRIIEEGYKTGKIGLDQAMMMLGVQPPQMQQPQPQQQPMEQQQQIPQEQVPQGV